MRWYLEEWHCGLWEIYHSADYAVFLDQTQLAGRNDIVVELYVFLVVQVGGELVGEDLVECHCLR
jgi:hypothetical protein